MPPKRKAAATKTKGAKKAKSEIKAKITKGLKSNKVKLAEAEMKEDAQVATEKITESSKKFNYKRRNPEVDTVCVLYNNGKVVEDYDCTLNQTNINHNTNKFYIIQVIEFRKRFYTWYRWGRVGEEGAYKFNTFSCKEKAIADFKKKFQDKTKNSWDERDSFQAKPGKYTLLEVEDDEEEDCGEVTPAPGKKISQRARRSKLTSMHKLTVPQGELKPSDRTTPLCRKSIIQHRISDP